MTPEEAWAFRKQHDPLWNIHPVELCCSVAECADLLLRMNVYYQNTEHHFSGPPPQLQAVEESLTYVNLAIRLFEAEDGEIGEIEVDKTGSGCRLSPRITDRTHIKDFRLICHTITNMVCDARLVDEEAERQKPIWQRMHDSFGYPIVDDLRGTQRDTHRLMMVKISPTPFDDAAQICTEYFSNEFGRYQRTEIDGGLQFDLFNESGADRGQVFIYRLPPQHTRLILKSAASPVDIVTPEEDATETQAHEQFTIWADNLAQWIDARREQQKHMLATLAPQQSTPVSEDQRHQEDPPAPSNQDNRDPLEVIPNKRYRQMARLKLEGKDNAEIAKLIDPTGNIDQKTVANYLSQLRGKHPTLNIPKGNAGRKRGNQEQ